LTIQPQIVLCVPGRWKSRVDLNVALLKNGYLLLGEAIAANDASLSFSFELQDHDPRMGRAFASSASRVDRSLTARDCVAVDKHALVLYVLSGNYGRDDAAEKAHRMIQLGRTLLASGGIAVKCDSSGVAHSASHWRALTREADAGLAALGKAKTEEQKILTRYRFWSALRRAYVCSPVLDGRDLYSCGMHLLGRPDVIVRQAKSDPATLQLMERFNEYVLAECASSTPRAGEGFRLTAKSARWKIAKEACRRYPKDDFFFNPYGYARLSR
jgi:hypothetical protein